jgi:hypothetical protein
MPRRTLRTITGVLAVVSAMLVALGCGGKEAAVVQSAFDHPIDSATIAMSLSAESPMGNLGVSLTGPYKSNGKQELPDADLQLKVQGVGPQPMEARLISTKDNAFVVYDGVTYEVGADKIAQLKAQSKQGQGTTPDVAALMEQMKGWFPETSTQEDADLDGEAVTRVTGRMDLEKALKGFMDIAKQSAAADPQAAKAFEQSPDMAQVGKFLSDPSFTLDVAKSDGTLRRVAAETELEGVPGGGKIAFSLQFKDVGKPVAIQAPASGRPIEELGEKLGALGAALGPKATA